MHVAIIPDGNRRWAQEQGLPATKGYSAVAKRGVKETSNVSELITKAKKLNITTLSLWVFSTENWKRPQEEQQTLFSLLTTHLGELQKTLVRADARFVWLGRREKISLSLRESLEALEEERTKGSLTFQLCLDYGGRNELLRAVNKAVKQGVEQTQESFSELLDSADEPDIIIRTSGEQRLSGFMPWQGAYAELFFVKKYFPNFTPQDLEAVVKEFSLRARRYGGA